MIISVVGAHGQIARHLSRLLSEKDHTVRGLVRSEDQFDDIRADGAEPVLCDVESAEQSAMDEAVAGSDVVVFAAGSGPDSGPERKETMDRDGAIKSVRAAVTAGAQRVVILSSMGTDDPPEDDEIFSVYLRAKAAADQAARDADIDATILRPGALSDDEATGSVQLGEKTGRDEIPRPDVAAVLAELVDQNAGRGATLEVISGDTPIAEAVAGLG